MKIIIVNTSDLVGGAARASYRLHRALIIQGIESQMIVQSKGSDDFTVIGPTTKLGMGIALIRPTIDQIPVRKYINESRSLFSPALVPLSNIVNKINSMNPDIVHLHWICGGMMKIEDIARINAPIVWSLHDVWAFTGGCHVAWGCKKFKEQCGYCPQLNSEKQNDLSRWVYKRKQKSYMKIRNMTVIGLSRWILNYAKKSSLFKDTKIINLQNNLPTGLYKPFNKEKSRRLWNLPQAKKIILFGGKSAISNENKGFQKLVTALNAIDGKDDVITVVYGGGKPHNELSINSKVYYLGNLHDDISLIALYNACDVMVVPSIHENLSNVIMESLSCGTPVVAFDIGGNGDMIEHLINGYLAKPYDTNDLAYGIKWVLNHSNYKSLARNSRTKIVTEFDDKIVAEKYIRLYKSILESENL